MGAVIGFGVACLGFGILIWGVWFLKPGKSVNRGYLYANQQEPRSSLDKQNEGP